MDNKSSDLGDRLRLANLTTMLLLAACVTGCVENHRLGEHVLRPDIQSANYVEGVFRYQNGVGSRLIDFEILVDDLDEKYAKTLSDAEDRMVDACTYLVELVVLNREGRRPGTALKLKALATASACAEATRDFDDVLTSVGSIAGF